jgi:hypothetical protein
MQLPVLPIWLVLEEIGQAAFELNLQQVVEVN